MIISLISIVGLSLFSPCFSNPCPSAYPCNTSFVIQPPFCAYNDSCVECDDQTNNGCMGKGRGCGAPINIRCNSNDPFINLFGPDLWFQLENISYNDSTLVIRDDNLSNSLLHSNCSSVTISFELSPIDAYEFEEKYDLFSSIQCDPKTHHILNDFCERHPWTCLYSVNKENFSSTCSNPPTFSFIWKLSFKNIQAGDLTLLSASFYNDPSCKAKKQKGKNIIFIAGISVGLGSLLVACCSCLLLCKRKKVNWLSSSSLLTQRESSDQYFDDLEMAGTHFTQIFSYEELKEATNGFSPLKELGDGGFGAVYKGKLRDGRIIAVKRLYQNNNRRAKQFMNEVDILSRLQHPNLVSLYGCTTSTSRELLLVLEYVSNGTVADHLHGPLSYENALTWPVCLSIAIETANALAYLHAVEPPVIHRDVKTNNILLDNEFHVKVGDFGLSRLFPSDVSHVSTFPVGTPGYVDPVYHECYQLTDRSDVYSFGVVLVELISSKPAVDLSRTRDEINLANLALNMIQRSELDELVDPALGFQSNWEIRRMISLLAELAFQCLQSDRDMRPSIKEVLEALKVIEKGGHGGDKLEKENLSKKDSHLLQSGANFSPVTVMDRWESSSTTPNISV
ncbi:Protein kinase family protein [Rhynchospora pubera]|uniref:Protein kinase family protein n=1 Tax=Rhynchospora pubera TaxID=906938 RepID=A0AAV8DAE3_9POAL|nr:Protein kinase family protein [Rhynchospora pubera]